MVRSEGTAAPGERTTSGSRGAHRLDQKIKLFELVVGELDVILGQFGDAGTLEAPPPREAA